MKKDKFSNINFYKEFFIIVGSIMFGFGLSELISLMPLTKLDKIVLFLSGGLLIMIAGQDLFNRRFKEFFKSLIWVLLCIIFILIIRFNFPNIPSL